MIHILGEPQRDMSLFDAIELAKKSEKACKYRVCRKRVGKGKLGGIDERAKCFL